MKFSEEQKYKFINLVLNHECLWNPDSSTFQNKQLKETAYDSIVKEMAIPGMTPADARMKFKNLFDIKKLEEVGSSTPEKPKKHILSMKRKQEYEELLATSAIESPIVSELPTVSREDWFDNFGKFVASSLRDMTPELAELAEKACWATLLEYQHRNLT